MSVYSYHTFILPFVWEDTLEHRVSLNEFTGLFDSNPNWVRTDMTNEYRIEDSPNLIGKDDVLLLYKEYQYFHPYVRRAIYGFGENVVNNFSFMPDKIRNKGHYYIEKNGRKYDLLISAINLKIFNTGIALFIMECENHGIDADGKSQANFEDVKNINDYGRRITLPYINTSDNFDYFICADCLSVEVKNEFLFEDDYRSYAIELNASGDLRNRLSLTHMCDFIKKILNYGGMYRFSSKKFEESDYYYIYPAVDDRMFVACYVCDADIADKFTKRENDSYAFFTDEDLSKSLYEFVFVDPSDGCTCVYSKMRNELLEQHTYLRWVDLGTIYSIANQSVMMLTNSSLEHLKESFLTQYIQMCCLCLAQKATLIHFQREASSLSANIEKNGKTMTRNIIIKLMDLQERYVAYKSQLYFTEASPQEQGIEMYDMIQESMLIKKADELLESHLESLKDAADTNLDFGFNRTALIFTYVGVILALVQDIMCFYNYNSEGEKGYFEYVGNTAISTQFIISIGITATLLSFIIIQLMYRRKRK